MREWFFLLKVLLKPVFKVACIVAVIFGAMHLSHTMTYNPAVKRVGGLFADTEEDSYEVAYSQWYLWVVKLKACDTVLEKELQNSEATPARIKKTLADTRAKYSSLLSDVLTVVSSRGNPMIFWENLMEDVEKELDGTGAKKGILMRCLVELPDILQKAPSKT